MITYYKNGQAGLEVVEECANGTWVNAVNPDEKELAHICKQWQIPESFIRASLDVDERSRTDKEGGITLILVRTPIHQGGAEDIPYSTVPLGIVITDGVIITVCSEENEVLKEFASGTVPNLSTAKQNRFILRLFLRTANRYLRHLVDINREIDLLEDNLQRSLRNEELLELLKYQKSLVYFTTSLRSNELMMERLQKSGLFQKFPEDAELLDDVLTENHQAIEMVGVASNILSQMMDAFASIISNNLNVVMKFLTLVTIMLMLPTLIASFYGMNVGLPLQSSPFAFLFTLAVSFGLAVIVFLVFRKKDWF